MIFNAALGGVGLNFKIVGGTEAPAVLSENAIWINTDQPITAYSFAVEEPEEPVEGMVWILVGPGSQAAFNALRKNTLQIYPLEARQYGDGAWIPRTAQSWQNGRWVEWWGGELFAYGNKYTNATGGWDALAIPHVDGYAGTPTITRQSNGGIKIEMANKGKSGVYVVHNKIDLTAARIIRFTGRLQDPDGYDRAMLRVWESLGKLQQQNVAAALHTRSGTTSTYDLDVSHLKGEFVIGFSMAFNGFVILDKLKIER